MLREQDIPLPRAVIENALRQSQDRGFAPLLERALSRIMSSKPEDRRALMTAALPFTIDSSEVFRYPCIVRSEQFRRVEEICHEKHLNPIILIAGALMVELGMAQVRGDPATNCEGP